MSQLVVDTDVVSYLFKNHSVATLYDADLLNHTLVVSFMTVAELERWAIQSKWGDARRNRLNWFLQPFTILAYDRVMCTKWAEVMVEAQARGFRIEGADAWIAATALLYDLPLVTHNRDDYRGVPGLRIISHAS